MTLKLDIRHLMVEAPAGSRPDPTRLKAEIERQLAAMLAGTTDRPIAGAASRTLTHHGTAMAAAPYDEASLARHIATRIHQGMKP